MLQMAGGRGEMPPSRYTLDNGWPLLPTEESIFPLKHGSSTGAILAFREAIAAILKIGGRFYLSGGRGRF